MKYESPTLGLKLVFDKSRNYTRSHMIIGSVKVCLLWLWLDVRQGNPVLPRPTPSYYKHLPYYHVLHSIYPMIHPTNFTSYPSYFLSYPILLCPTTSYLILSKASSHLFCTTWSFCTWRSRNNEMRAVDQLEWPKSKGHHTPGNFIAYNHCRQWIAWKLPGVWWP